MPDIRFDPPLPSTWEDHPFVQRVELHENDRVIATAQWHAPAGNDGVVQLLDLSVEPSHRRQGLAGLILTAATKQIVALGKLRKTPVRRIWINVEQKTQIQARAFLTKHSYHHVATVKELLKQQDALVYMRSLD